MDCGARSATTAPVASTHKGDAMVKLTCTLFGTSDGMGGGDTVLTYNLSDGALDTPRERYHWRTHIVAAVTEEIGDFDPAIINLNGDWVIVDQDDHESGIIAIVKITGGQ